MNNVTIVGRLTKDPEVRYTDSNLAIADFTIAVGRGKDKDGNDKGADFIKCKAFRKTAELIEKYSGKGKRVAVQGKIETGSYTDRNGKTAYFTDVLAEKVEFIDWNEKNAEKSNQSVTGASEVQNEQTFFPVADEDIPF